MVENGTLYGFVYRPFGVVCETIYLNWKSFGSRLQNTYHMHEVKIDVLTAADIIERISAEHIEVHHSIAIAVTHFTCRIEPF